MSLFGKNPNEVNYTGGKKHFTDVIKNTSPENTLIWLNPEEDFNAGSTLVVAESEEALFFHNGVIESVFTGGRYKLSTENYPFVSRLVNAFSGGISTFNCKVYFVNKTHTMEILWGTDSPVQVRDPIQGIATSIRARGAYKIQIADSRKFLQNMVGNRVRFMVQADLTNYFRSQFSQYIKSAIAGYVKNAKEEILGICAAQNELAEEIARPVAKAFEEYGIRLVNFSVQAMDIPMDDPGRAKLEAAFAERRQQDILGYTWAQRQSAEIMKELAGNPGSGGMAAAGAGLGVGMAAAGAFGDLAGQLFQAGKINPQQGPQTPGPGGAGQNRIGQAASSGTCPHCGSENMPGAKFCSSCGKSMQAEKKFCPDCGAENMPGSKFCSGCGKSLAAPKKTFCPNCGEEMTPGSRFCSQCGHQMQEGGGKQQPLPDWEFFS